MDALLMAMRSKPSCLRPKSAYWKPEKSHILAVPLLQPQYAAAGVSVLSPQTKSQGQSQGKAACSSTCCSLFLPGLFFLKFLLYGGQRTTLGHQLSQAIPGRWLVSYFLTPVIIDVLHD